jgi:O-antigen/teichoic acid export membrane protein
MPKARFRARSTISDVTAPSDSGTSSTMSLLERARQLAGRVGWGIADQALSSLTNFVVGVSIARSLGIREFGTFSVAFATYLIVLNASRGLATDPLVVRYSGVDSASWRQAVAKSAGVATAVGLVAGVCCVVVGMLLTGSAGATLLMLGVTLPGLLLQDSWRYAFFSAGRGGHAFANDLVWALSLLPLLMTVAATEHSRVLWFVLAWGGSATFAAVVGGIQARVVPRLSQAASWLVQHRDLGPRYLGENLSHSGALQLRHYGLGLIAGLAAVGSLRAAELLLGPVYVIIMGLGLMAVPEGVRLLHRSRRRLGPFCVVLGSLQAGVALAWGMALLVLLPGDLGVWLLGPSWQPASELLLPVTLSVAGIGFWGGAFTGLRALGAASRSLRAQGLGSALYLVGALGGAAVGDAAGAAWGSAAATAIAAGIWWWQLDRGLREFRTPAEPGARVDTARLPHTSG